MSLYTHTFFLTFKLVEIHRFVALTADDFEMPVSYAVAVSVWRLVMQLLTEARM
jgi:hypothetical protein